MEYLTLRSMYKRIRKVLIDWYLENARDLPWRKTKDPYKIWISEVILQQTQIKQGESYYERFIEMFPDNQSLSLAKEEDVLRTWQGLGYYSRARNLHRASGQIETEFGGHFPKKQIELMKLKGVGSYTSAAVASIAFNEACAVVDGNVERLLSRLFLVKTAVNTTKGKKEITAIAEKLLDKDHPGDFNQAMMDYGSMVCKPKPDCGTCVLTSFCKAYASGDVNNFPVKKKMSAVKNRYLHYLLIRTPGTIYIRKRTEKDIWANMYDLPCIEKDNASKLSESDLSDYTYIIGENLPEPLLSKTHILTHQKLHAKLYEIINKRKKILNINKGFIEVPEKKIDRYPFSNLTRFFFENLGILKKDS